jgi:hypothetical protein
MFNDVLLSFLFKLELKIVKLYVEFGNFKIIKYICWHKSPLQHLVYMSGVIIPLWRADAEDCRERKPTALLNIPLSRLQ